MRPRPRGVAQAARTPAEGEPLARARRKFALNRRSHLRCTITYIAMSVIGLGCLITLIVMVYTHYPLWPWAGGTLLAGLIGIHAFAKQSRLEDCPHCRGNLLGFATRCACCGQPITGEEPACPACRVSFAKPPRLAAVCFCTTCGSALADPVG